MECGVSLRRQRPAGRCTSLRHTMCSPGEVVPGSWDPGSGGLHRLLGGEVWIVTCACTQASWWFSSSLSISCPSLGSALIATPHAHLWSSFRQCSESPLLSHQETKSQEKSLDSLAAPDFFPDSLLASHGTLAPSGCVHAAKPRCCSISTCLQSSSGHWTN